MYDNKKPKSTIDQQILILEDKGILFNEISKEKAKQFLEENNYYYRLASFRKNFKKDTLKGYNIDFNVLVDLSSIDLYLREFLFSLCLDVEHAAKTIFMTDLTYNNMENGYDIVDDFSKQNTEYFNKLKKRFEKNQYLSDMFHKRNIMSVWVLLEIADFGAFTILLDQYLEKYSLSNANLNTINKNIRYVKNIRNACAHNNIFLINLFHHESNFIKYPTQLSSTICKKIGYSDLYRHYNKTHDLLILTYFHNRFCSKSLNQRRYIEGQRVIKRFLRNNNDIEKSEQLNNFIKFFKTFVDFLPQ